MNLEFCDSLVSVFYANSILGHLDNCDFRSCRYGSLEFIALAKIVSPVNFSF